VLQEVSGNALLQRRCMLCIAVYAEALDAAWKPSVYAALLATLTAPETDLCLQLTAVHVLRALVDDFKFDEVQFAPCLQPLLAHLPTLMNSLALVDSHVRFPPWALASKPALFKSSRVPASVRWCSSTHDCPRLVSLLALRHTPSSAD
jgi:hypothetical protein